MEDNKEEVKNTLVETQGKQVPYEPASESCNTLDSVVPRNLSQESMYFNRFLKTDIEVAKFVKEKLHYASVEDLCKAFVREQIDAIATAIWNFEKRDFGLIVSDQTGLGKGRIVAGLIRYSVLELRKMPIFFTEKTTLFSDIYRDLFDIGLDAGIPMMRKKKAIQVDIESYTDEVIEKIIKVDIKNDGDLRVDYDFPEEMKDIKDIFKSENEDILSEIIDLYREHIAQNGDIQGDGYEKVSDVDYRKEVEEATKQGRMLVKPFSPFKLTIKDKSGNLIYKISDKEVNNAVKSTDIPTEYKLMCLMYSTIRTTRDSNDQITPKYKLIQKYAANSVIILDESHNAAGVSNTFDTMTNLLNAAQYAAYVSATWAKRPDNMPLYGIKTAIKEAFLSKEMLISAFTNGDLALQESTSASLVKIGQLLRREKLIESDTSYYYENQDGTAGQTQISKLDRVSMYWSVVQKFEEKVKEEFYQQLRNHGITKQNDEEEYKKYKFSGKVARRTFELFNYFLLALKVEQTLLEANRQLQNGKKVIISIANTLESAFNNIKQDYQNNIPYGIGDIIKNDFTQVLGYLLASTLRFKYRGTYTDDSGEVEFIDRDINILQLTQEQRTSNAVYFKIARKMSESLEEEFNDLLRQILDNPIGLSLAPIDQIKQSLAISGFSAEEITGRTKYLQFDVNENNMLNLEEGVISRREKKDKVDIINDFNSNALDCLIINQSGSTGVSMHAVPTTEQGKIVAPVNVVPTIPPTSLEPRSEVKQRAMIILQMELDINKEVQKLGRINRTGQVFPPIYRYIISAIPSEARLSAMMQKKLKSLMANTSGSQEQGEDMFNSDDLFSQYAIDPFNETIKALRYPSEWEVTKKEDIYNRTKMFYFMDYDAQREFYAVLSSNLKKHIAYLIEKGQYFGAVSYKNYGAKSTGTIPYIIGNNNAFTEFGGHVFAETAECQVFDQKNTEADIKKAITLGLTHNVDGNTRPYNEIQEYYDANESNTREMVDRHIQLNIEPDIKFYEERIDTSLVEKEELLKQAKSVENLPRILEIDERLTLLKHEKSLNQNEILKFMESDDIESAKPFSTKNQQINAEIKIIEEERISLMGEFEDVRDIQRLQNTLERGLSNINDNIERAEKNIARRENDMFEQEELRDQFLSYIKKIGNVFQLKRLAETLQHDPEIEGLNPYFYVYNEIDNEEVILVSVKFNQTQNSYFTPGQIVMKFKTVTNDVELNVYNLFRKFSEQEIIQKKQAQEQIVDKEFSYVGYWDEYISKINTGRVEEKVFLSGNLLRGMAFQSITGVSGRIVKYNSFDNKLLTSLELDKESTKRILPRFSESADYSILASLNEENLKNLIIPTLAKRFRGWRGRSVSSQIFLDVAPTFLEVYAGDNSLYEAIDEIKKKFEEEQYQLQRNDKTWYEVDENDKDGDARLEEKYLVEQVIPLYLNNLNSLRFNITSTNQNIIKFLESIVVSMGSEAPTENKWLADPMYNEGKIASTLVYNSKGKFPKLKGDSFANPLYEATSRRFTYKYYDDGNLLEGIYLSSAGIISDRASAGSKEYFQATWNLAMNYNAFISLLTYLEKAKNIQLLATTSNEILQMANPPYVFSQSSSAIGIIEEEEGVEIVENVGEMTIVSLEDIINEFANLYK